MTKTYPIKAWVAICPNGHSHQAAPVMAAEKLSPTCLLFDCGAALEWKGVKR